MESEPLIVGEWFDQATDFWTLRKAASKAARGCSGSPGAMAFLADLEVEVLKVQRELHAGDYQPGPFHTFPIRDPKPRIISAAPFRDRVVHHALCAVMEPTFEAEADPDSYACRRGKGTRAAVWRIQRLTRRWPWFAKLDVLHCFETAHLELLHRMLADRFPDPPLLAVLGRVLERGETDFNMGLPIGNLTSQHFANFLLGEIDREARRLEVGAWVRYMDDMFVFGATKRDVTAYSAALIAFISVHMQQSDKVSARRLGPVHNGVPALGFRIWPQRLRLDGARRRRFLKRQRSLQRAFRLGEIDAREFVECAQAAIAWVAQADTLGLRRSLFAKGDCQSL